LNLSEFEVCVIWIVYVRLCDFENLRTNWCNFNILCVITWLWVN